MEFFIAKHGSIGCCRLLLMRQAAACALYYTFHQKYIVFAINCRQLHIAIVYFPVKID